MGITLDGIASAQLAKHLYHVTHYHNGETKKTDFGYFQLDIAYVLHNRLPIVCFYTAYFRKKHISTLYQPKSRVRGTVAYISLKNIHALQFKTKSFF